MTYYVGNNAQDVLAGIIKRYFYGLRRNDDGELYMMKADQLQGGDENVVTINTEGAAENNFLDFEEGIDFLDGLDDNHNIVYNNLRYPQMRWDGRSVLYYVDPTDGQLIVRINEIYQYPDGISSEDLIYQNG